jgi:hypothetical protein
MVHPGMRRRWSDHDHRVVPEGLFAMSDPEFLAAALHRDELALAAGLNALSTLVAGAGTLEQLLAEIAGFTMQAVPGADGAGVTMLVVAPVSSSGVVSRRWGR